MRCLYQELTKNKIHVHCNTYQLLIVVASGLSRRDSRRSSTHDLENAKTTMTNSLTQTGDNLEGTLNERDRERERALAFRMLRMKRREMEITALLLAKEEEDPSATFPSSKKPDPFRGMQTWEPERIQQRAYEVKRILQAQEEQEIQEEEEKLYDYTM